MDVVLPARTRGNIVGPSTTWMRETLTSVDIQLEQAGERHVVDNSMAHLRLPSAPRESPGGRLGWSIRHPQPDREDSSSSRRNYDYTRGTQTGTQNDSVPAAYQGGAVTITENPVLGTSDVDARSRPMVTPISYTHPDSRHGREVLPLAHVLQREGSDTGPVRYLAAGPSGSGSKPTIVGSDAVQRGRWRRRTRQFAQ